MKQEMLIEHTVTVEEWVAVLGAMVTANSRLRDVLENDFMYALNAMNHGNTGVMSTVKICYDGESYSVDSMGAEYKVANDAD